MHAAACIPPTARRGSNDCWFGGDPLPEPQLGAFHLHWNGGSLEAEPYLGEGHAVRDMSVLEGVPVRERPRSAPKIPSPRKRAATRYCTRSNRKPSPADRSRSRPNRRCTARSASSPTALDFLHLSSAEGALWGAAGKSPKATAPGEEPGSVTVVRRVQGVWSQPFGPGSLTSGITAHPLGRVLESEAEEQRLLGGEAKDAAVSGIAAEPGSEDAWLALRPPTGCGRRA